MTLALLLLLPSALAVTRDEVLDRAQAWVDAGVPYSYSAWYTDPTTGICCYRTDCSGFVSAVWGIDPPGNTTYSFAGGPWDDGSTYEISESELLPGDALNYPGDPDAGTGHIMLYVDGDFSSGWVEVYEEYTPGADATFRWRAIDPSIYLPIRYTGIEDCAASAEVCNGVDDDCDDSIDEGWVCEAPQDAALSAWRGDRGDSSDLDGDGRADVCARASSGLICALSAGTSFGALATLTDLSNDAGFDQASAYTTIRTADVTGDGRADVCARDPAWGFRCWPSTGDGFGDPIQGPALTDAAGWADPSNYTTLRMADLDGDGRSDLCARADTGVLCWLSEGAGFPTRLEGPPLTDALGWDSDLYYPSIRMGDLDGDGRADLCARASTGIDCWRFDGDTFIGPIAGPTLSNELGWDDPANGSTIALPDITGDGRSDVCARASDRVVCWPSTSGGFGASIDGPALSNEAGWDDFQYYSTLRWADLDGDGRDDLCARSATTVYCWLSTGTGFADHLAGPSLSNELGWDDWTNYATITLGDVDGDGRADLCARADSGVACWLFDGTGFSTEVHGPTWSDALSWDDVSYFGTLRLAGPLPHADDTGDSGDTGDTGDTGDSGDSRSGDDTDPKDTDADTPAADETGVASKGSGTCGCATQTPSPVFGLAALALLRRVRR